MVSPPLPKDGRGDITDIKGRFAKNIMHRISGISNDDASDDSDIELDSHADSQVVGRHAKIREKTGRKVSVSGFTNDLIKPIMVGVVHDERWY